MDMPSPPRSDRLPREQRKYYKIRQDKRLVVAVVDGPGEHTYKQLGIHEYSCRHPGCPKRDEPFAYHSQVVRHILGKHTDTFMCKQCNGLRLADKYCLEKHMYFKHGQMGNRFACQKCRTMFRNYKGLTKHLEKRHGGEGLL